MSTEKFENGLSFNFMHIAIITGGETGERDVSIASAKNEDVVWNILAEKRDLESAKFISHKDTWK